MHILNPGFKPDDFFVRARDARSRVLMLDYDGTLAPFRIKPAEALPYAGVVPLLDMIQDAGHTRVVVVSGRWIKDLVPLLGLKRMPEIWGSHGWERLSEKGNYIAAPISDEAMEALAMTDKWAPQVEKIGARRERKPTGVAIHWRGLSNIKIAQIRDTVADNWKEFDQAALRWHDFDGGIELRPTAWDKGRVVRTLIAETGSDAVFAYLGDDLTDESAFKAMTDRGVAVLVRSELRPTMADLWLKPPEEVKEFLTLWHSAASHP